MIWKSTLQWDVIICLLLISLLQLSCNETGNGPQKKASTNTNTALIKNTGFINTGRLLIKDGDLITRSDDDFESLSLQNFSQKDRTYSHSGIIFEEDSNWFVYHCMAGPENPGESIKKEAYDSFISPVKKTGFGIFRYRLSPTELSHLHALYKNYYTAKLPFDKSFNLKSDDSMYCSEVIYKSLKSATGGRITLPVSTLTNFKPKTPGAHFKNTFFKRFDYVGIDDLYLNPFCKPIFSAHFN